MKRTEIAGQADPEIPGRLAEALRQRGPFCGLAVQDIARVVRLGSLVDLQPGETLIREGDGGAAEVYVLIEGTLTVRAENTPVARLERTGEVVGEVAVVLSSKRTADVVAESAARVLAIPASFLSQPEFADAAAGIRSTMLRDEWISYDS